MEPMRSGFLSLVRVAGILSLSTKSSEQSLDAVLHCLEPFADAQAERLGMSLDASCEVPAKRGKFFLVLNSTPLNVNSYFLGGNRGNSMLPRTASQRMLLSRALLSRVSKLKFIEWEWFHGSFDISTGIPHGALSL